MNDFHYVRAPDTASALRLFAEAPDARFLGGGTNLVDLMRERIEAPAVLIDVSGLSQSIDARDDGGLMIGAGAKNTAVAAHRAVRERFPVLAQALLDGASAQIRNMATAGGNLMQRTRCLYFYDDAARCNKREPGSGCDAVDGFNRNHAILGASVQCVATHPSDMCVALAALDAIVHVESTSGKRTIALVDFHRLPGDSPDVDTVLQPGELITAIEVPPLAFGKSSRYRKVRDRASYAFALVSVAAAMDVAEGAIRDVRIALGGVAHKPWRALEAEKVLKGAQPGEATFRRAADAELAAAVGLSANAFKISLARRTMVNVLESLANGKGSQR